MKKYLEPEGKLGNQLHTNIFSPDKNFSPRNTPVSKKAKKKRVKMPVKRRFKVRVIEQPMTTNPTLPANPALSTEPTPTVDITMATTQIPEARTAAAPTTAIPVTVYNLAHGKFKGISYPTKWLQEEGPPMPSGNNPFVEQQPKVAVTATAPQNREDTPWPNTMPTSTNLFEARASWPILQMKVPTAIKAGKAEEKTPPRLAAISCAMVKKPSQEKAEEKCGWGPHHPISTKTPLNQKVESTEDWNGEGQDNQQRNYYPQGPQCPHSYDILDRFIQQLKLEREWNE